MTTSSNARTETVRQLFEMACPDCSSDEHLMVVITAWAELSADGTDPSGAHDWDDASSCKCNACDRIGTVKDFRITNGSHADA